MLPISRFKIADKSMEPNFKQGDYVLVNKLSYIFKNPSKGDVVIVKHPHEKGRFLIKRVLLVTDSDEYYVIGDNKDYSQDSRHFGSVKKDMIIGNILVHFKK